jgi:hypothetical protein
MAAAVISIIHTHIHTSRQIFRLNHADQPLRSHIRVVGVTGRVLRVVGLWRVRNREGGGGNLLLLLIVERNLHRGLEHFRRFLSLTAGLIFYALHDGIGVDAMRPVGVRVRHARKEGREGGKMSTGNPDDSRGSNEPQTTIYEVRNSIYCNCIAWCSEGDEAQQFLDSA